MDMQKSTNSESRRWYDKKRFVLPALFLFFPLGLALMWMGESFTKSVKIGISIFFGVLIVWVAVSPKEPSKQSSTSGAVEETSSNESTSESIPEKDSKMVSVNEVLKTDYFDITANSIEVLYNVNTGNPYSDLKKDAGNIYVVVDATFKNVDTESRMIMEGSILINYNGKDYEFDKTEMVMAEGYGAMLEQINPLTIKRTKLVWKIPEEISGNIIWEPGRASSGQGIILGSIGN